MSARNRLLNLQLRFVKFSDNNGAAGGGGDSGFLFDDLSIRKVFEFVEHGFGPVFEVEV